jgi:hypothetical protein
MTRDSKEACWKGGMKIHITRFDSDLNIKIELTTSKYKTYTCGRL